MFPDEIIFYIIGMICFWFKWITEVRKRVCTHVPTLYALQILHDISDFKLL